jgi:zinc protease
MRYLVLFFLVFLNLNAAGVDGFNLSVKELTVSDKKVFYATFKGVNVVTVQIGFKNAGQKLSPKGKQSLVALLQSLLGESSAFKNRDQILAFMREHNLVFNVDSDDDNFIISGTCPVRSVSFLFKLISEVVFDATFLEKDLKRVKQELSAAMLQSQQFPQVQMDELIKRTLMLNHPYGYLIPEYIKSLSVLTANDLKQFIRANFTLENVHVAVSGEVDEAVLIEELQKLFAKLPKKFKAQAVSNIEIAAPYAEHHFTYNVPQTMVKIVHKGIDKNHPDFFALQMASLCLSDQAIGVLWKKVREEHGLTYDLTCRFQIDENFNSFVVATSTNTASVNDAFNLIKKSLSEVLVSGFSEEDFKLMKASFLGNYKRSFSSSRSIATKLLSYSMNGFSKDRYQQVISAIEALTVDDVNSAFKKFFDVSCLHVFTVGR